MHGKPEMQIPTTPKSRSLRGEDFLSEIGMDVDSQVNTDLTSQRSMEVPSWKWRLKGNFPGRKHEVCRRM